MPIGTLIDVPDRMELFRDALSEMEAFPTLPRLAWGLSEVSNATGLSVPFLRAEVRTGRLSVRRYSSCLTLFCSRCLLASQRRVLI